MSMHPMGLGDSHPALDERPISISSPRTMKYLASTSNHLTNVRSVSALIVDDFGGRGRMILAILLANQS